MGVQLLHPEFQAIGTRLVKMISGALAGFMTVDEALKIANKAADRQMRQRVITASTDKRIGLRPISLFFNSSL